MTAKKTEAQEPARRVSGKDWKLAKTATRRSQLPGSLKQTFADRIAKTKKLHMARDLAKAMTQEKIDEKRVSGSSAWVLDQDAKTIGVEPIVET